MKLFSILESNVHEALELTIAKDYAEHIRRPETEKVINDLMSKLKQQGTYTGKESKRAERIYFNYEKEDTAKPEDFKSETFDGLELTLYNNQDLIKELFGKTFQINNGKDYLDGLATDSRGQKVGIGKMLNMVSDKLKKRGGEESLRIAQRFDYAKRAFQEDEARNTAISGKNKKRYIVISKANYDIAGMTSGRSWNSCMSLTSGNGQKYVHCDIKEGTLIAYLINENDTNIQRPIARVLIKPFISTTNYKDYIYVVEEREYGTAPGFVETVQDMFRDAQPDKEGRYKLNRKLYNDSGDNEIRVRRKVEVISQETFDKLEYDKDEGGKMTRIWFYSLDDQNINPRDIKKIKNIITNSEIQVINLSNLSEISNIETSDKFTARELDNLTKISNLKCKEIQITECGKLELMENVTTEELDMHGVDYGPKISIKKITGNVENIYISKIDQESIDNLNISELDLNRLSLNFTGESLNEFASKLGEIRVLSLRGCENLKELPKKIGTYDNVLVIAPEEIKSTLKVPEGANYRII